MKRLLEGLARLARRRYHWIFIAFAVAVAVSLCLILRLTFDTDVLNLLPRKDPTIRSYVEALQDFGSNTLLLVAIRLPPGAVVEPYESFADELAGRLGRLPEVKSVQHRTGNPEELFQTFFPKAVLFLDARGRQELVTRLSDAGIGGRASELRRLLATPEGMAAKDLIKLDPFGLSEILLGSIDSSRGTLLVDWSSGYYLSRDHSLLLVLVEPKRPPQDIPFDERLTGGMRRAIAETLARWPALAGADGPPAPAVGTGGPHFSALADASLIKHDMLVNILTSALGVFVLFLVAFRRAGALLYAFVPLLTGLVLAFGFAAALFGALSSATSVCAALLIGLGIDFVIVSYGRYVEARRAGAGLDEALVEMSGACGSAVVAGAATTAATFYAFTFTEFTGLRQMGLLTGTGILFCMLSVLFLLPAMLAWSEDRNRRRNTAPRLHLTSFGVDRATGASLRHPRAALVLGAVATGLALLAARHLSFDESMKTMRPSSGRGTEVGEAVAKSFGSSFDSMILALSADSLGQVLSLCSEAAAGAQKLVEQGVLQTYSATVSLIPPLDQQREALAWLRRERGGELSMARIRASLTRDLAAQGLRPEAFAPGLDLLARALDLSQPIGIADFTATPQTKLLLERYLKRKARGWRAAVYLYPPANRWRREAPPGAIRLAASLGPRATLSGVNVVNQRVRTMVLRDAWIAGLLGLLLVAGILWLDFRSAPAVALALLPLFAGLALMLGAMALLGIQANFINVFVTTMVIGIGTDYGIYILHRHAEVEALGPLAFHQGLCETGKAVSVAAISTIVGFGSIVFSHYPGLRSTGEVAILGALFTSLVAVTMLPAYMSLRRARLARRNPSRAKLEDGEARGAEEAGGHE